jgi:hypothetical protein
MAEDRVQRRLAAILAADVVGYSRLIEQDEARTLSALKERRKAILQPVVSKHHGRIVKVMGDGVLVEFASAVNAVTCAMELQKRMAAANDGIADVSRIDLRVGINLGVVEGGDLYGDAAMLAAAECSPDDGEQGSQLRAGVVTSRATPANATSVRSFPACGGTMTRFESSLVKSCRTRFMVATGLLFDPAVDPNNGALYLVWQDDRFSGGIIDQIAFSMSTNGGNTWTKPVQINRTPHRTNIKREAAFVPTVAVNSDGVLVGTYYDFRRDNSTGELADQWAVFCNPATSDCADRANWGSEKRLTDESFDILDAPVAGGHFLGDYMGSASANEDVHPAFGIADGANQTSIFTRRITLEPTVATQVRSNAGGIT